MNADAVDGALESLEMPRRLTFSCQSGKPVRNDAPLPRTILRKAQQFRWSKMLILRTEGAYLGIRWQRLRFIRLSDQFLRTLGALGRNDHPLLCEGILAQLRHEG